MVESNSIINSNNDKGSDDSKNNSILLKISRELKKEKIVSEIRYTPALDCLKMKFSKDYDNQIVYLQIDIQNWYKWTENLEARIRRRMSGPPYGYQYWLIENTILDNLDLILKSKENNSQSVQKDKQEEEEEVRKTIHLKKYVFEGKLLESTTAILKKNPKFIAISKPTSSLSAADSINTDAMDKSEGKTDDNIIIELFDEIEDPNETENAIPAVENQQVSSSSSGV